MDDNGKAPRGDYSVEEILAEARLIRDHGEAPGPGPGAQPPENAPEKQPGPRPGAPEEILEEAQRALKMEAGEEPASGGEPVQEPEKDGNRKKHRFSLFGRKKKRGEFREEEDLYYGLQLRPLEEYRKEYEKSIKENGDTPFVFGQNGEGSDASMAETFERIHRERHDRLEKIMRKAGLDPEEILPQEEPVRTPEVPAPDAPRPEVPVEPPAVTPGPSQSPEVRPPVTRPVPEAPGHPGIITDGSPEPDSSAPEPESGESNRPKAEEKPPVPVKEPELAPPPAHPEQRVPPPRTEPDGGAAQPYRASGSPVHVIRLKSLRELLTAEAALYPPPEQPGPIPFPKRESGPAEPPEEHPENGKPEPEQEPKPDFAPDDPEHLGNWPVPGPLIGKAPAAVTPLPLQGSGAAESPEPEPGKKKSFRLFGSEETENEPGDEPPPEPEELDDYTDPEDAPSVLHDLVRNMTRLSLRLAVTGISALLLLLLGILEDHSAFLIPGLHSILSGPSYPIIQLFFLLVAAGFTFPAVWNGLKGLVSFHANPDSAAAVFTLAALIQNAALIVLGVPDGLSIYAPLAAAALFLNSAGKLSMARRILINFRYLSSPEQKYAVRIFDDYNTSLRLARDCVVGEPRIAYQARASFLRNFLRISYTPDPADQISGAIAPAGFLLSLGLCVACAVRTGNAETALTAFAASCCVCTPFMNMLCANLPVSRLAHTARRGGSMISGWAAIQKFSETNAVMLDAQDLFPRGTVILNGIRTFAGQRIDDAILDAAALMCAVGGPLSDLFDQIIKNRRELLPKIGEPAYEDGRGVTGTVSGRPVLVGNRDLMKAHGIEPPSRDYERKYLQSGKRLVYLAHDGALVAMFIVTYRSDLRRSQLLRRMERNGVSLIVRTCDPDVTPAFLSECFGLDEHSATVLPEPLGQIYTGLSTAAPDRAEAVAATKGRPAAMIRLLVGCIRQRSNIIIAVALQAAAVALGFSLVAFLSLYSGLAQLSITALTAFEAFWAAAIVLVPRIRRP